MSDNKQLKDGVGNLFGLRLSDRSAFGDGTLVQTMVLSTGRPIDYGTGGCFQHCGKSSVIPVGLAANAPIYAFQWPSTLLALIRRVRLSAWSLGTGFTSGLATFDLYAARPFTAQYTGGTFANLSGGGGKMRSSLMAPSLASVTYTATTALVPGTRTLDPDPLNSITIAAPAPPMRRLPQRR